MPIYQMTCDKCEMTWDLKMSMQDYSDTKDSITCSTCGEKAYQKPAKLRFKLEGVGWYADTYGNNSNGTGYNITQQEIRQNLDLEKKIEGEANNLADREKKKITEI